MFDSTNFSPSDQHHKSGLYREFRLSVKMVRRMPTRYHDCAWLRFASSPQVGALCSCFRIVGFGNGPFSRNRVARRVSPASTELGDQVTNEVKEAVSSAFADALSGAVEELKTEIGNTLVSA